MKCIGGWFIEGDTALKVIGFISREDPFHDKVAWSGTHYKLREAIELAGFEVRWIPYGNLWQEELLNTILKNWNCLFTNKKWLTGFHFRPIAKIMAREIDNNPIVNECDYLFFPGGVSIAIYIKSKIPIINLSDSTVKDLLDYYWVGINKKSRKMSIELNMKAAQKAFLNICSSHWAIDSLINDYHCDKSKCYVLEFGPNIDTQDFKNSIPYESGTLRVLFSGRDWIRKGGDIAVEVIEIIRRKGIDAHLVVVGPRRCPHSCEQKTYIEFIGYLDKNNSNDYHDYICLYREAHIFLLPTKAECSAIVYSEAAAAGLPCYSYMTGGTGNYVINGVNGYTFPEGSPAIVIAEKIIEDLELGNHLSLREGAFRLYKERLNWSTWSKSFAKIMQQLG